MTQLNVQIMRQNYVLTCPDGQEGQLLEAVERVDQQLQSIRASSKLTTREKVGVVLSVNLAYENLELRKQLQALQEQLALIQHPNLIDTDAERLQALEQQALHDHTQAHALVTRLDEVLAGTTENLGTANSAITCTATAVKHSPLDIPAPGLQQETAEGLTEAAIDSAEDTYPPASA